MQVAGKDDETGEDLIQRDDDKPESVRNRSQFNNSLLNLKTINNLTKVIK